MGLRDRTKDFRELAEPHLKQKNLERKHETKALQKKTKFAIDASQIAKGIHDTTGKLANLSKLAKNKSLFDDPAIQIEKLTYVIKNDLTNLNKQIDILSTLKNSENEQTQKNADNIISALQKKTCSDDC